MSAEASGAYTIGKCSDWCQSLWNMTAIMNETNEPQVCNKPV